MQYNLIETIEAVNDVTHLAAYMIIFLKNHKAANDFVDRYDKEVQKLKTFPFGYRGISLEYRGYEIRIKSFDTYNVFFVVDYESKNIIILRVLKDRQNWQYILKSENTYHFK